MERMEATATCPKRYCAGLKCLQVCESENSRCSRANQEGGITDGLQIEDVDAFS